MDEPSTVPPTAPPAKRTGWLARGLSFDEMAVGLLFIAVAVLALFTPAQGDTFWHLRAGADIWRSGHVPRVDLYSHTAYGTPWPDHEWLSQLLMYAAYRAGRGMPGLEIGAAVLILAAAATVYRLMVGPRLTRFALLTPGLLIAASAWSLRPQILTLFLLAFLVWLLVRDRQLVLTIPPYFLLWANAHGGVALGGVVLAACSAAAVLRWTRTRAPDDRRRAQTLAVVLPLAGLAVAGTPLGFDIYRFVVTSAARSYAVQIAEWFVLRPDSFFGALFWAATIAFAILIVARRRAIAAGDWADWAVVAAALALLPLGIRSARNIGPFLILAVPAASHALGRTFRFRLSRRPRATSPDHPRANLALVLGLGAAALAVVPLGWRAQPAALYWNPISPGALRALDVCPGPLYNFYGDGGSLVWFAPTRRDFVDGRQDPFPVWLLRESFEVEHGAPYLALFAKFGVRCAFIPAKSKLVDRLRGDGWRAQFIDADWAVLAAPALVLPKR